MNIMDPKGEDENNKDTLADLVMKNINMLWVTCHDEEQKQHPQNVQKE